MATIGDRIVISSVTRIRRPEGPELELDSSVLSKPMTPAACAA
jgi:hypothetical protein